MHNYFSGTIKKKYIDFFLIKIQRYQPAIVVRKQHSASTVFLYISI